MDKEIVELQARVASLELIVEHLLAHQFCRAPDLHTHMKGVSKNAEIIEDSTTVMTGTHRRHLHLTKDLIERGEGGMFRYLPDTQGEMDD